jgi:hypothetical protein
MMKFTNEFLEAFGMPFVKKQIISYDKGWIGDSRTLRIGISGDDFVHNQLSAVVIMMKAPRLVAPKVRRKNTLSNKKLNRRR